MRHHMLPFHNHDRPYVIAEIGGNHGGDADTAMEYVETAAAAGADAAKFQLYQAEHLITRDHPPLPLAGDEYDSQFERFQELELTRSEWEQVVAACDDHNIDFVASVFDTEMLAFAAERTPFLKIASGDVTNLPLLRDAVDTGLPLVVSTGFTTLEELDAAVAELPTERLTLLHCMGSYPTPDDAANLAMIETLRERYDVPVGYSDHTIGTLAPITSAAHGAQVIEKHFTLDKSQDIGDHRLSATPGQLATIVEQTARVTAMHGTGDRSTVFAEEREIRETMRRSLATARDVEAGETLTEDDLTALRPASGLSPLDLDAVVGRRVSDAVSAHTILTESHLAD
ncbi:N-acetylneuraminate synthase family protein [Haloarcula sp. JP-L23]|uniref:N-acetylneuraminate synthase family protein n=1 Tax=Haloarcula sp. JP-L23 TaxID=2716717 RepID=UPI00140EBC88|nr:N-acetylneuraminate synthase [Haloarcula sp. JP-L23]